MEPNRVGLVYFMDAHYQIDYIIWPSRVTIWAHVSPTLSALQLALIGTWSSGILPFECRKIAKNLTFFFSKKLPLAKKVPDLSHLELIWPSLGPSLTCLYHPPRVAGSHVDSASNGHAQRTDFNDLSKSELKKKHDCILQWLDIWSVPFQL